MRHALRVIGVVAGTVSAWGCGSRDTPAPRAVASAVAADSTIASPTPDSAIVRSAPDTVHALDTHAARSAQPAPAAAPAARVAHGPRRVVLGDLDLTGLGHDEGSPTAPVVLIDFSDFGCPYCGQFTRESWPVIQREYVRTGKVFFKFVPFVVGMFPHSAEATRAVECVAEQGKFDAMADHVYEAQREWKKGGDPRPLLTGIAAVVGADTVTFGRCYDDRHTDARTARANDITSTIGVRVTPSFVVNERPVQGALPIADFRRVIDAALLLAATHK